MAPRISEQEKEAVLGLIIQRRTILIEHRGSRGEDINQERSRAWSDVVRQAQRTLNDKRLDLTRARSILKNAMKRCRILGQITKRFHSITGGGNNQELQDKINEIHTSFCPSEDMLYQTYRSSPSVFGLNKLADSMILVKEVKRKRIVKIENDVEVIDLDGEEPLPGMPPLDRDSSKREKCRRIDKMNDEELMAELDTLREGEDNYSDMDDDFEREEETEQLLAEDDRRPSTSEAARGGAKKEQKKLMRAQRDVAAETMTSLRRFSEYMERSEQRMGSLYEAMMGRRNGGRYEEWNENYGEDNPYGEYGMNEGREEGGEEEGDPSRFIIGSKDSGSHYMRPR